MKAKRPAGGEARSDGGYHRSLLEASLDPFFVVGLDGAITDVNDAAAAATGRERERLIGTDFSDAFTGAPQARAGLAQAFREGAVRGLALELKRPDGTAVPVLCNASVYKGAGGRTAGVFAAARDVSGLNRAESEARRLAAFPRLTPIPVIEFDRAGAVGFMNQAMRTLLDALPGADPRSLIPPRWAARLERGQDADVVDGEELTVDGRVLDEKLFFSKEFQSLQVWATDVTDRRRSERALARVNRALRTLSLGNETLVRAKTEAGLLDAMCRVLVEAGGYRMAWIGLAERDPGKTVRPAAVAGRDDGYVGKARITWADDEHGRGPTGTAIRTGSPQVNRDFAADPRAAPWREEALMRGYASSAALPLLEGGEVLGALMLYAAERDAFDEDEVRLLVELAADLSYGIAALRAAADRAVAERRLRDSLKETVGSVAATLELRDPYTAGHQRRVAQLAARIAGELGLPEDKVRGVYLAGLIHDIGKIAVPVEILCKPGQLTPLELSFLRVHPQAGHDVVKGIAFPWPIAEAILQHHERLDGSGYPRALAGEAIIAEARIVAVADVAEAIMAHRPYRPARGLEAAFAELEAGKGRLYDAAAAEACIALLKSGAVSFGDPAAASAQGPDLRK